MRAAEVDESCHNPQLAALTGGRRTHPQPPVIQSAFESAGLFNSKERRPMPWSNQSGGGRPMGSTRRIGRRQEPWGSGGPPGSGAPPDLEDILRRSQDRLKSFMPGGSMGWQGPRGCCFWRALAIWLLTGFYTVRPNEVGINMIFGKYTGTTGEGLRYNLPYPIGRVQKPNVTEQQRIEVGYRSSANAPDSAPATCSRKA